jgi:DNA-binding PadR family transcriptional regulator
LDTDKEQLMTTASPTPESFLPLTPAVFHILLALADGEKHGYAIMQEVESGTGGTVPMGPGTLYGSIKRMLAAGLIEETDDRPDPDLDDQRRRYYKLTGLGGLVVEAEAQRLAAAVSLAKAKQVMTITAGPG